MALNIAPIVQGVTRLLGGVVDNDPVLTNPLTIQSGVTLDGSQVSLLGGIIGQTVGAGVRATISGASVTNGGTIIGATVGGTANPGVSLTAGGAVSNLAGGAVNGINAGIAVAGSGGTPSLVSNLGSVAASAANGTGVLLDTGALTNGGTIAAVGVAGVGVAIGTGTLGNSAPGIIRGGLNGIASTGNTAITNAGSVLGTAGSGVTLAAGSLTNAAGGTVTGAVNGILGTGAATIDNAGQVIGTAGNGVTAAGGTLTNEIGAAITGATNGAVATAAMDVQNLGAILGTSGTGVAMAAGNLANAAAATISGLLGGVTMTAPGGTVDNLGSILGTGANAIGVNLLGGGTVIDAGIISGRDGSGALGGIAVNLGGTGGNRLVLDPGAVLNGDAVAAGVGNTLELAAGLGTDIVRDIGTTLRGFDMTVLDNGAVAEVLGAVTTPGTVTVGNGAALTLDGPVGTGVSVDLSGQGARLTLAGPGGFAGAIVNLGTDDTLDLTALGTGASVRYDPAQGGLTVTTSGGVTSLIPVTLAVGLDPASISLNLGSDGAGGITVTVGSGGDGGTGGTGGGTGGGGTGGGTGTGGTGTGGGTGPGGTGPGGTGMGGGTGAGGTVPGGGGGTITAGGGTAGSGSAGGGMNHAGGGTAEGATIAYGTGLAQGDSISIDPTAVYLGRGHFALTGHVASGSGVSDVEISAVVDGGGTVDLGKASVAADGSFTFNDKVGRHLQGFVTATETDGVGGTTSVASPYSLEAGIRGAPYVAQQELYSPDGTVDKATTNYHPTGNNDVLVHAADQTFVSGFFDTYHNGGAPGNTFVFNPGHGLDIIHGFRVDGADHDTISLPAADFASMADVLRATRNTADGAVIHDPVKGDTIQLAGVNKAELRANQADFAFHA